MKQCFAEVSMPPWSMRAAGWCMTVWSVCNCRLHLPTCFLTVGSPGSRQLRRQQMREVSLPGLDLLDISLWPMMLPRDHVDACGPCFLLPGMMKSEMQVTVYSLCYCLMLWWCPWALLPLGAILKKVDHMRPCWDPVALETHEGHAWVDGPDNSHGPR